MPPPPLEPLTADQKNLIKKWIDQGAKDNICDDYAGGCNLTNVTFVDSVPKSEMPLALAAADACIAILKPLEEYKTTYPNKVFDYMAAGRPVVSSSLATVMAFREVIDVVSNDAEWMLAIDRALTAGGVGDSASRRAVARANSWESRVDELDRWMLEIV